MKHIIINCCILLFSLNSVFSQSDTVRWSKYLFIETRLTENGSSKYVYEYQDTLGNIIIPQGKYGYLKSPDKYGFINAWKKSSGKDIENNVGFIDIHENILIPFHYSRAFSFSHNLACAKKDGKTGYINRKGEIVIPFVYNSYEDFNDYGVVLIQKENKEVLIDTLGNKIISENHSYQKIKENLPHDQVLWIQKNGKWAFLDLKGNPLTPFIFDDLHPANICYQPNLWFGEDLRWFYKGLSVVEKDRQFAVINKKMEYVVPFNTYQWISSMSIGGLMIVKQNNKYGLLNSQLKIIQPIEFDTISNSPAQDYEQNYPSFWAKKNGKYYIFDTLGYWKDSLLYDNIQLLQANFYLVTKNGESWRIDRNGTKIIEDFSVVRDDENGFIAKKNSKFGLIDNDGEIILPFEYEDIISEHRGNIFVKKNGKWGVVNGENQLLVPCKYDYIEYAWDESSRDSMNYIVVQNDKFGKINETGNEIFPCLYDGITTWVEYGPSGHYVMIGDKMGLVDYNGDVLIPIQYDKVQCIDGKDWAIIYDKSKIGLYSIKNKSFILSLEYDFLYVDRDWFGLGQDKPTRIITCKDGIVNILDKQINIVRSNVPKPEIKKMFEIDIDEYQYSPCSYELLVMLHNKSFTIPDCLLETLKKYNNTPIESIYYKMGEN